MERNPIRIERSSNSGERRELHRQASGPARNSDLVLDRAGADIGDLSRLAATLPAAEIARAALEGDG